ncbi:MAG: YbhB/YbcL family Raf kinase inhibitor-like protein [Ginsengibacter sp.]|nr:YbhB/YbcL family Raf kinase inhibitor-like protein [Hanamia sp.]
METKTGELKITSPAFENEGNIPAKYSCDGEGVNPPLHIGNIPEGTKTLALIAEDPDAPNGTFVHWVVYNIDPAEKIAEASNPGTSGDNGAGKSGYHPACPPSGSHRYYFHVFALDKSIDMLAGKKKEDLENAIKGHIIAKGTLMGRYERKK